MFTFLSLLRISSALLEEIHPGIWHLDASTLEEALVAQPNLLVEFYSPSCSHCKDFAPHFFEAGKQLKSLKNLNIAMIDGSANEELLEKFDITGFPTLIYFMGPLRIVYSGKRHYESVIEWVSKRDENPYKFTNDSDIEIYKQKPEALVYFGDVSHEYRKVFDLAYQNMDKCDFALFNSTDVLKNNNVTGPVVGYYSNSNVSYFNLTNDYADLARFIEQNKPPKIYPWSSETISLIMNIRYPGIIFFIAETEQEKYLTLINELADEYHSKLLFTITTLESNDNLDTVFSLFKEDMPFVAILKSQDPLLKYVSKDLSHIGLAKFIEETLEGKTPVFYKSMPIPVPEFEKGVRVLVGSNFNEVAFDRKINVLVFFYSKKAPESGPLLKIIERVAYETKKRENLVICKIDLDWNEINGIEVASPPFIRVYLKATNLEVNMREYPGKLSIIKFLDIYTK